MDSNITPLLGPLRRISAAVNDLIYALEGLANEGQDTEQDKAHKDDQRPVAPRIPLDRAQRIAEAAEAVGLASKSAEPETAGRLIFDPVFQAVLATQGVEKIGALNVDQAEAVEAFLAEEAKGA